MNQDIIKEMERQEANDALKFLRRIKALVQDHYNLTPWPQASHADKCYQFIAQSLGELRAYREQQQPLRDEFAKITLKEILRATHPSEMDTLFHAGKAYKMADAMMEARNK